MGAGKKVSDLLESCQKKQILTVLDQYSIFRHVGNIAKKTFENLETLLHTVIPIIHI